MVPDICSLTSLCNGSPIFSVSNFTASLLNTSVFLFHTHSHLMILLLTSYERISPHTPSTSSTHLLVFVPCILSLVACYHSLIGGQSLICVFDPTAAFLVLCLLFYSYTHIQFIRKLSHLYLQNISSISSFLITSRATIKP